MVSGVETHTRRGTTKNQIIKVLFNWSSSGPSPHSLSQVLSETTPVSRGEGGGLPATIPWSRFDRADYSSWIAAFQRETGPQLTPARVR